MSRWLLTHPDHLAEENVLELKKATAACRNLDILYGHIRNFAAIMAERRGTEDFLAWLDAVEADDLPALHSLASCMRRDLSAVINGMTLEHSSGAVEGAVTRVIMWNLFCQADRLSARCPHRSTLSPHSAC